MPGLLAQLVVFVAKAVLRMIQGFVKFIAAGRYGNESFIVDINVRILTVVYTIETFQAFHNKLVPFNVHLVVSLEVSK